MKKNYNNIKQCPNPDCINGQIEERNKNGNKTNRLVDCKTCNGYGMINKDKKNKLPHHHGDILSNQYKDVVLYQFADLLEMLHIKCANKPHEELHDKKNKNEKN